MNSRPGNKDVIADLEEREKRLTPKQKQFIAEGRQKRDLAFAGANIEISCTPEQYKKIETIIWQVPLVKYNAKAETLTWHGHEDLFVKKILDVMDGDQAFCRAVLAVKPQIESHIKKNKELTENRVKVDQSRVQLIQDWRALVDAEGVDLSRHQTLKRELDLKKKKVRHFSPEEKETLIDSTLWTQDDLDRSLAHLLKQKPGCLSQISKCKQYIKTFQTEQDPSRDKISDIGKRLDANGLEEAQFKDLELSKQYYQSLVDKLQKKIDREQTKLEQLESELQAIQYKINIMNMVNDARVLDRDFYNWGTRRQRVIDRNEKLKRELQGLETLRENLNHHWRELTHDDQDLCSPLLRTERKLFVI